MLHELTHVVDPKLALDRKKHPWAGSRYTPKDQAKYYNAPHEIDAYVNSSVEDILGEVPNITADMIRNDKSDSLARGTARPWEKIWHQTNPKAWKKLLNTLYAAIDQSITSLIIRLLNSLVASATSFAAS